MNIYENKNLQDLLQITNEDREFLFKVFDMQMDTCM